MEFELRILGPVEALREGTSVEVQQRNQRALLAYLALHRGQRLRVSSIVDALWTAPPKTARNMLQVYVSALRRALGRDAIATRGGAYELRVEASAVDALRFAVLVEEGRQSLRAGAFAAAVETLRGALALWRGDALADVGPAPFAEAERARLEDMRLLALEDLMDAELALGNQLEVVGSLEALVAQHPLRERLRGQLMMALYRAGRQADALASYREGRTRLVESLGIEPRIELRLLERAILSQDVSLERAAPLQAHVPMPAAPLVGRASELRELEELLTDDGIRLLTLTGPGGVGKTRLALEAARHVAPGLFDLVRYIELDEVIDPALVPAAVTTSLSRPPSDGAANQSKEAVGRPALVILDGFEQLVGAAPSLAALLRADPALKLLVTSRSPLHIRAEHEYPVLPLLVPPSGLRRLDRLADNPSVALFVARARTLDPHFALSAENSEAIAEICRQLEGLPLSIELAAAWTKSLAPDELVLRLTHRLDLLVGGPQDAPVRHRTLRGTLDASYSLLEPRERRLFAALAVFAGSFSLEAAARICGSESDVVRAVLALQDNAFLRREGATTTRFAMLDTIREYAWERLDEAARGPDLQSRHAKFFTELAEALEPELAGAGQAQALERLEADSANLQAALTYATENDPPLALRLAVALRRFWYLHGRVAQGRQSLESALSAGSSEASPLRTTALRAAGVLAAELGDTAAARRFWEQGLADARAAGLLEEVASGTTNLGIMALMAGEYERANDLLERAAGLHEQLGDTRRRAVALTNLGVVATLQGRLERATEILEEALKGFRATGDLSRVAGALQPLARAYLRLSSVEQARPLLVESIDLARGIGDKHVIADCLEAFAAAARMEDDPARSATLLGAATSVRESIGAPRTPDAQEWFDAEVDAARTELGEDLFELHWGAGTRLEQGEAIEAALAKAITVAYELN